MSSAVLAALLGWLIALAIFLGFIALLRYIDHRERMALIARGINPHRRPRARRSVGVLRAGLITAMVGLALTIGLYPLGYMLPASFTSTPLHVGPWLLPGLIPLGVGGALVMSFLGTSALIRVWAALADHHGPRRPVAMTEGEVAVSFAGILTPLLISGLAAVSLSTWKPSKSEACSTSWLGARRRPAPLRHRPGPPRPGGVQHPRTSPPPQWRRVPRRPDRPAPLGQALARHGTRAGRRHRPPLARL